MYHDPNVFCNDDDVLFNLFFSCSLSAISGHIIRRKCDITYSSYNPLNYVEKDAIELALKLGEIGIKFGIEFSDLALDFNAIGINLALSLAVLPLNLAEIDIKFSIDFSGLILKLDEVGLEFIIEFSGLILKLDEIGLEFIIEFGDFVLKLNEIGIKFDICEIVAVLLLAFSRIALILLKTASSLMSRRSIFSQRATSST